MRTRIKICGVKTPGPVHHAALAGADAFGLVFHEPSIRNLSIEQAVRIAKHKPAFMNSVAVMVNPDREFVQTVLERIRPDYIQFHGEESGEYCRSFGVRYIRSVRVRKSVRLSTVEEEYHDASALLVDAYRGDHYGGTGDVFNWNLVDFDGTIPVILAGGLDFRNVPDAIRSVGPFAVDVSSGVETDGSKDIGKIRRFCKAVLETSRERGEE